MGNTYNLREQLKEKTARAGKTGQQQGKNGMLRNRNGVGKKNHLSA